jgi:hypothetical protein
MKKPPPIPGITRDNRISEQGLQRLEQLLARGGQISDAVLAQWIRRYGTAAALIIARYGRSAGKETPSAP